MFYFGLFLTTEGKDGYQVTVKELSRFKFDWEESQNQAFDGARTKGGDGVARIVIIFLCWKRYKQKFG